MENLDPPPLPPKSGMGKWLVFALRAASFSTWVGDEGLLFHFILSKIVEFKIILNDWSLEKISQFCLPRISLLATGNYESLWKQLNCSPWV